MIKILETVKAYGRTVLAGLGFIYDWSRYFKYASWRSKEKSKEARNYHSVHVYHALEKSLSFTNRRSGAGWTHANVLIESLETALTTNNYGFHDKVGISVLKKFAEAEMTVNPDQAKELLHRISKIETGINREESSRLDGGTIQIEKQEFQAGALDDPEKFFHSRYSLREYSDERIDPNIIHRAINLAMKSPSVCNRQAWHVYHLEGEITQKALSFQNGNRGFGDKVKNLLIVTTDLNAFISPRERYQHWIDGGMFAMSLIWALHSLKLASCCLNWSQSGSTDKRLRKEINIRPEHTIIMMISVGHPKEDNVTCKSLRRPMHEVYTKL